MLLGKAMALQRCNDPEARSRVLDDRLSYRVRLRVRENIPGASRHVRLAAQAAFPTSGDVG